MFIIREGLLDVVDEVPGGYESGDKGYIPWKKEGPCLVYISGYDPKKKMVLFHFDFPNPFIACPTRKLPLDFWQKNFLPRGDPRAKQAFDNYEKTGVWKF